MAGLPSKRKAEATALPFTGLRIVLEAPFEGKSSMGDLMRLIADNGSVFANMSKTATHVVSNGWKPERRAFKFARQYGVPVVKESWLHASIAAGHPVDVSEHWNGGDGVPPPGGVGSVAGAPASASVRSVGGPSTKRARKVAHGDPSGESASATDVVGKEESLSLSNRGGNALVSALKRASSAAAAGQPKPIGGSPLFPSFLTARLFSDLDDLNLFADLDILRNSALMTVLGSFLHDFVTEKGYNVLPASKLKKSQQQLGVGRTQILVPRFPNDNDIDDEVVEQKRTPLGDDFGVVVAGFAEIVTAYHEAL